MNRERDTQTPTHPHARTPGHPETHTDTHTYARTYGFRILAFEIKSSRLKFLTRRRKCHGLGKTNFALQRNRPTDRTSVPQQTKTHSWHISRHQETPKSMHASGASGPVASRDDGAIFLTAAKTYQESVRRGFLLTLWGGSSSERRT